jgi:hypothetical protein
MGGTSTHATTAATPASIPAELIPLVNQAVAGSLDAMGNLSLDEFTKSFIQDIPGLSPDELSIINDIFGWANDPSLTAGATEGMDLTRAGAATSQGEQDAMAMLAQLGGTPVGGVTAKGVTAPGVTAEDAAATQAEVDTNTRQMLDAEALIKGLTSGEVGSSPATAQAMKAWEQFVQPTVMAGQALTGNLGGGATEEALGLSRTAALTPLMAKEIDTRQAMAALLGQLGLGASGQELAASTTNAQLGTQVSEGNANRDLAAQTAAGQMDLAAQTATAQMDLAAQQATLQAQLQKMGLDVQSATTLAAIAAGTQQRSLQAGGQLAAIGTEQANLQIMALSKELEAAGMPRDIATKQAQAEYNDFLRRQAMAESLYMGPTGSYLQSVLPPGSVTNSSTTGMFGT